jgi:hypothetical protein
VSAVRRSGDVELRHRAIRLHDLVHVTLVTLGLDIDLHRAELRHYETSLPAAYALLPKKIGPSGLYTAAESAQSCRISLFVLITWKNWFATLEIYVESAANIS